jgi:hypothetical protein
MSLLAAGPPCPAIRNIMANYPIWNIRRRHEWLSTPMKKKRVKKRSAVRIGLWDAWQRNKAKSDDAEPAASTKGEAKPEGESSEG